MMASCGRLANGIDMMRKPYADKLYLVPSMVMVWAVLARLSSMTRTLLFMVNEAGIAWH